MPRKIIDRETDYHKRKYARQLSPERQDAYEMGDRTPDANVRSYADTMKQQALEMERENTLRNIAKKKESEKAEKSSRRSERRTSEKRDRWDRQRSEQYPLSDL